MWQLSPRALIQPPKEAKVIAQPAATSSNTRGTLYKAIFDYTTKQADELSLKVN